MQEDTSAATAYERFKLQWMLEHGFTLRDLVEELEKSREETPELPLTAIFSNWEFGFGFGSQIWPCFEEFLDSEYKERMVNPNDNQ